MVSFMRNTDAFALGMETDARLRSTVVSIVLLDRSPDWDVLVDRVERVARLMPMFRQRIVPSLPPAPPRWVYDPDFDLRYHLRRLTAPSPGSLSTVLEIGRRAELDEFDHARPMWSVTLVEGLEDGGAALVVKLHHSLADGIGAVQISQIVFDVTREPADHGPLPPVPEAVEPGRFDALRHTVGYEAALLGRAPAESHRRPRRRSWTASGTRVRPCGRSSRPRPRSTARCSRSTRRRRRSCESGARSGSSASMSSPWPR